MHPSSPGFSGDLLEGKFGFSYFFCRAKQQLFGQSYQNITMDLVGEIKIE
jgi:hypothetical protein